MKRENKKRNSPSFFESWDKAIKGMNFRNDENNENDEISDSKNGFFDLMKEEICRDKSHNPPTYIVIPKGKGYRHICPTCGKVSIIIPSQISLNE